MLAGSIQIDNIKGLFMVKQLAAEPCQEQVMLDFMFVLSALPAWGAFESCGS